MLILVAGDKLSVITSLTAAVDVHASWVDNASVVITPGRTNTKITVAGTVTVVAGPAASTQRNVKTLHVLNRDPTITCDVTIQHDSGTAICKLFSTTLKSGDAIEMTDQDGFRIQRKAI